VVEALTALSAAVLFIVFGPTAKAALFFVLICFLIVATFTDLDRMIIPNWITLPGIVLGLSINALVAPGEIWRYLLGAVVGGGALLLVAYLGEWIFKKESMGGGDLKLAALAGTALIVLGRKARRHYIPFGPFIAIGAMVAIFWGGDIIRAYTDFLLL
jgi:leader peptidase (prepilin peptidase)/N-methyltransferase